MVGRGGGHAVQRREDDEVQREGVEDKDVPAESVAEDDAREAQEHLFERVEHLDRSASFLRRGEKSQRPRFPPGGKGGREKRAYPTPEGLERVHALLVLVVVLAQLLVAPRGRECGPRARRPGVVAVALEVPDLLVQFEVIGLKRLDLGSELRDCLELPTELLERVRKAVSGDVRRGRK